MSLTNCRFYEEKYPEIDSFVMVNVKQVGNASQDAGWALAPTRGIIGSDRVLYRSPRWVLTSSFSSTTTLMA